MSNFELKELKNLPIEIIDGDRGIHYPPKTEFSKTGFCVFLNTGNVTASGFDFSTLDFIDEKRDSLLKKGKLRHDDIVLTTRGTVGNVGFFNEIIPYKNIRINSGMVILRSDKEKIAPYYLYSFLKSELFRKQIKSQGSGSAQPQLPISSLRNISIPHVDFPTQQKIVTVLSALDSKIELNNRINAELEAMAKTLYDYWFVQFDFPDRDGKPYKTSGGKMVFNAELKIEIPGGWKVERLSEFSNTASGGTPLSTNEEYYKDGNISWVNSGELNSPYILKTKNYITEKGLNNSSAKMFPANTLLVAMYGATAGKSSLLLIPACTNQAICAILPANKVFTNYLKFAFTDLYSHLVDLSSGSARDNLSQDGIKDLKFIVPSEPLLTAYDNIISPIITKISINIKQKQELAELRDWLLPMLMNGQVTVK